MVKDIHSTGLTVIDLQASVAYYCTDNTYELVEHFDLVDTPQTRATRGIPNPEGRGALLRGPAGFLELVQFTDNANATAVRRQVHEAGIRHVCIRTQDVHGLFDEFVKAGASWHARPSELGTGLEYAYIRDLEGNLLELEGLSMIPPGVVKPWFDHTALVTSDIDRLVAFYETLTDRTVNNRGSFGPDAKFDTVAGTENVVFDGAWIVLNVSRIEIWRYTCPETRPARVRSVDDVGWSHLCFEVDDLDAERERLEQAGVEFEGEAQTCPMGRSAFMRDVDGNLVKLLEVSDSRPELSVDNLPARPFLEQLRAVSERHRKGQQS